MRIKFFNRAQIQPLTNEASRQPPSLQGGFRSRLFFYLFSNTTPPRPRDSRVYDSSVLSSRVVAIPTHRVTTIQHGNLYIVHDFEPFKERIAVCKSLANVIMAFTPVHADAVTDLTCTDAQSEESLPIATLYLSEPPPYAQVTLAFDHAQRGDILMTPELEDTIYFRELRDRY